MNCIVRRGTSIRHQKAQYFHTFCRKNVWGVTSRDDLKELVKGTAKRHGLSLHIGVWFLKEQHILSPHFLLHVCMYFCVKLAFFVGKELQLSKNHTAITPVFAL